jgi:sigma-B regulation protein RsbU (phosphoserine phosphatase)
LTTGLEIMTAFIDMGSGQQAGVLSGMFAPNRQHSSHYPLAETEIAVRYLPMKGVSGDYYDLLPLHEEKMGLAIGDVCGKGIGAAFLMASLCTTLRAQVQTELMASGELLARLNQLVCRGTKRDQFVTLSYGIWDGITHTFTYSSAGHPPAIHYQADTGCVRELDAGGIVLGVCEDMVYPTESVPLGIGDALVFYTDGITEASNETDEVFGVQRLSEVVAVHGEEPSEGLASTIMGAASEFAQQGWQDDVTLMVVKRAEA